MIVRLRRRNCHFKNEIFSAGPLQYLPRSSFTLTLVDECSQAKEASVWILEPRTKKLVLAGDYHQLPPTVHNRVGFCLYFVQSQNISLQALAELSRSMFERLLRDAPVEFQWTKYCASKLVHQYRSQEFLHILIAFNFDFDPEKCFVLLG